jgi:hypothetical protein
MKYSLYLFKQCSPTVMAMSQQCKNRSTELISHPYSRRSNALELNVGTTCAVVVNVTGLETSGELQRKRTVGTSTLKMEALSYVPPKCWQTPSRLCGVIFQKSTIWIFEVVNISNISFYTVLMNITSNISLLSYTQIWVTTATHHLLSYWLAWDYWRFNGAGQTDTAHVSWLLYASPSDDGTRNMLWNVEDLSLLGSWHRVVM